MASGTGLAQPSSAPAAEYGSRPPRMVDDERSYNVQGELMLLLLLLVFALLFTSVFIRLWCTRRRDRRREGADPMPIQGSSSAGMWPENKD
jgi:hypothetical protein